MQLTAVAVNHAMYTDELHQVSLQSHELALH